MTLWRAGISDGRAVSATLVPFLFYLFFFYRCQIIDKMEVPQVVCNRVGSLNSFFRLLQRKETDSLDGTLHSLPRYFSSPPLAREREERAWNLSRCSLRQVRQIDSLPPTIHIVTVTAYFSPWTYVLRPPSISKNCRFSTSTINTDRKSVV